MTSNVTTTLITGVVLDEGVVLSLADMCRISGLCAEDLIAMVEEGLLDPLGSSPMTWHFPANELPRLLMSIRLQRDLHINLAGVALALELLDELRVLRSRLSALEDEG